eukprot:6145165-Amphidinium_carterae.1
MDGHMPVLRYLDQAEGFQKHWRLHSNVRHAIARFQHSKWNSEGRSADTEGAYLLIWRQSPKQLIETSARKVVTAKFDFWKSEDVSIEM